MKSKVLLINPSFKREEQYGEFQDLVRKGIPLSLGFLAGYLLEKGVEVKIVDEQWGALTDEKIKELIGQFQPSLVGITSLTPVVYRSFQLAQQLKKVAPEITVILGNVHPTILPEESLKNEFVDIVVRGEGEVTLWECVQYREGKKDIRDIPGVSYKREGEIVHNKARPYEKDLDKFPRLAYEHICDSIPLPDFVPTMILTSRGCPYRCIFCSSRDISGYVYRMLSPRRVVEDVEFLIEKYDIKGLWIADDNFVVNKKRTEEICRLFMERGINRKVTWGCQTRGDAIDGQILEVMKEAGCVNISFGIETGSQRLLDMIDKNEKVEDNARAVRLTNQAGIMTRGAFILGLPTETRAETIQTIKFAKSLPLDVAKFALATPYPGTELYNMAVKEGVDVQEDWSSLSTMTGISRYEASYVPRGRTSKELKNLQLRALLEFYLRPKQISAILKGENVEIKIKSYKEIGKYFMVVLRLLKKVFFN
ncbi:MAG: B12-binding domain-containing radical SAM protein [bacterium]